WRWAKEKIAEIEHDDEQPFRRSLPAKPITAAYEALLQPMVLGKAAPAGTPLQRLLAANPIFDALAAQLEDHEKDSAAGVVDFLALFFDVSRPIEERVRRFEERRPQIEAAPTGMSPQASY